MHEREKQRATHLFILLVCTFMIMALVAESLLLGWEKGAIVLLLLGVVLSWVIHITEKIPESIRLWLYFTLTMLATFFYGIHETSMFDLAPLIIMIIILYSTAEKYSIIRLCVIIYFLIMCYDFVFVLGASVELSPLAVSRICFHFILVYLVGYMTKIMLKRRKKERKTILNKIAELEETNRRTEDFLTNVSHELRTPINAVTGITAVMLKNEEDEAKKKDLFSIQVAGQRLFSQIGDILDYTEIDTGRIKVSEEPYMMLSVINDIIIGNRLSERGNKRELIFDIDVDIPSVLLGDEKKIKKILEHLINNAFKFTKKGGIYVRVYALHKKYGINLCMKVCDTGEGIGEDELVKIKERFYQSNGGRNRRAGGLGLGLPIVYGMVSAMEGFMQIESTVGKGTTVSVSIPQKVFEENPCMVVENPKALCVACYFRLGKCEIPEVRDYYNEMISHMIQGLDMPLHRVSDMDELEKLTTMCQLTHLFIGKEEYEENRTYFEELESDIKVVVVAEDEYALSQGNRAKLLKKPFYSLPIVNILNAETTEEEDLFKEKYMVCEGVKVLVVDDEPMNLMVAEGIFRGYKMSVTTAEGGRNALELCEKEDFDLIFLDHMMPEMDGVETLKRLRKIYTEAGRVPMVIAFTANAVSGAREMFLREGFDEFLSKPVEPLELDRILRKVLPKSSISYVNEKPGKDLEEDIITRFEHIGIQTQSGIQYCCGDRKFYVELLNKFAKDAERKGTEINEFFKKEDFESYTILVHALKSTAKTVGADSLSENAKQLEMAAKNHDINYVREHHAELLAEYRQVVQDILRVLDPDGRKTLQMQQEDKTEIAKEELLQRLTELKEGLDTFEADKAELLIRELNKTAYNGISLEELLYKIGQDVDDFEFASASEKVEDLIKKVEGGEIG